MVAPHPVPPPYHLHTDPGYGTDAHRIVSPPPQIVVVAVLQEPCALPHPLNGDATCNRFQSSIPPRHRPHGPQEAAPGGRAVDGGAAAAPQVLHPTAPRRQGEGGPPGPGATRRTPQSRSVGQLIPSPPPAAGNAHRTRPIDTSSNGNHLCDEPSVSASVSLKKPIVFM